MKKRTIVVLILLPVLVAIICLCIGRMSISPKDVFRAIFGSENISKMTRLTVINTRVPRVLLALLAGAGLSVAGCCFQGYFANPLATPDTMGIASGASFGAALGILLGFGNLGVQFSSFAFGIIAVLITKTAATGKSRSIGSMILAGIMVGSLFSALVSLAKFVADTENELPVITYWLMGSLAGVGYKTLAFGAPIILVSLVVVFALRWRINLLCLSEDEIVASGVNVKRLRGMVVICATAMTASVIAMCGQVGWIGLIVPHMCRMIWGNDNMKLVPASICIGSAFMVVVDTCARSLSAAEIPISILTAIVGAPFFIILLRKKQM